MANLTSGPKAMSNFARAAAFGKAGEANGAAKRDGDDATGKSSRAPTNPGKTIGAPGTPARRASGRR